VEGLYSQKKKEWFLLKQIQGGKWQKDKQYFIKIKGLVNPSTSSFKVVHDSYPYGPGEAA
jgi:hypothetical protein